MIYELGMTIDLPQFNSVLDAPIILCVRGAISLDDACAIEARERIISGLSQAVIIVEGGKTVMVWIRQLGRKDKDF